MSLPYDPATAPLGTYSKEVNKNMYVNVKNGLICNSPKLEPTQVSNSELLNNLVVHPHRGILFINTKTELHTIE